MPQFSPSDLFLPLVGLIKKHSACEKYSPKSVGFFQQSKTKQRKRHVLNMRNRKEVFFSAATCLRCCGRFTEGDNQHHFLMCKVITFLAFVIQSEIQRNMISVISFNSLGEHTKGEDVFSARCETATSKSEHSRKDVTVL